MEMKTVTDAEIKFAVGVSARADCTKCRAMPSLINTPVRQPVPYGTPTYIRRGAWVPVATVAYYLRRKGSSMIRRTKEAESERCYVRVG